MPAGTTTWASATTAWRGSVQVWQPPFTGQTVKMDPTALLDEDELKCDGSAGVRWWMWCEKSEG